MTMTNCTFRQTLCPNVRCIALVLAERGKSPQLPVRLLHRKDRAMAGLVVPLSAGVLSSGHEVRSYAV
jgi:hypothetical protein